MPEEPKDQTRNSRVRSAYLVYAVAFRRFRKMFPVAGSRTSGLSFDPRACQLKNVRNSGSFAHIGHLHLMVDHSWDHILVDGLQCYRVSTDTDRLVGHVKENRKC